MILLLKLAQNAALTNGDCNSRAVLKRQANTAFRDSKHIRQILFFKTYEASFSVISHAKNGLRILGVCTWASPITPWDTKLG